MSFTRDSHRPAQPSQTEAEKEEERWQLRRLQMLVAMVTSVLNQDPDLTPEKSRVLIAECKTAALAMFPDKNLAFELIYRPRLERVVRERFGG